MSKMFIRVKSCGAIYPYNDIMAKNPGCEVVAEEVAFPERFLPKGAAKRKSKLALETVDIPEEPVHTPAELAAEASRGLPE